MAPRGKKKNKQSAQELETAEENSTSSSEPELKDGKPNIYYWLSALRASNEMARPSRKVAKRAWDEYLANSYKFPSVKEPISTAKAKYPVWWSSIRTMQPALYSRTPVTTVERSFNDAQDNIARIASIALQRLGNYLIRSCPFDRVQYATRDDFFMAGKATNRVRFDSKVSETPTKVYYTQIPDPNAPAAPPPVAPPMPAPGAPPPGPPGGMAPPGAPPGMPLGQPPMPGAMAPVPFPAAPQMIWVDDKQQPLPEGAELQEDENGSYAEGIEEAIEYTCCELIPVYYYDILHTPNARYWEEIDWIAFKWSMTRKEAEERFGEKKANDLTYVPFLHSEQEDKKDSGATKDGAATLLCATGWEIWDKKKKQVLWVDQSYKKDFLDIKEDPYELEGFFPCPPFILGTIGAEDLYAVPDFAQLEPMILQIDAMARRLQGLIRATRRKGVFSANIPELADLANSLSETEFIGIKNYAELLGDGGLDKVVKFFPTEEFVAAASEMAEALQLYEQKFYELFGLPDILRGVSDPTETAAAQQQKGKFLSLRFSAVQREFQRLVATDIELLCDLAIKKFPESKLKDVMGVHYMEPQDQEAWPQVLMLLRNDSERKVRIDIETDSTITMNQNEDIEQRNYLAKTVFEGLSAVAQASNENPTFGQVALKLLIYVTRGLRYGKEIEEELVTMAKEMQEAQKQPPPPDPKIQVEQMKQQGKMQELQLSGQIKQQEMAGNAQIKQAEMAGKMQIEQMQAQADMATKQQSTQADIQREDIKAQAKMAIEDRMASLEAMIMQMRADLEERVQITKAQTDIAVKGFAAKQAEKKTEKNADKAFKSKPPGGDINIHIKGGKRE